MKAINKKIITIGFALFIIGFTNPSFSQNKSENPIEFRIIGNVDENPVFKLAANNTEEGEFLIKIKDANNNLLFSENLKGKNIWRKYRIDIFDEDLTSSFNVRFEVTNLKSNETFVYNAIRKSRVVDDIIVAKL